MQTASAGMADLFPTFLARFPPGTDFQALARETKAFRRARGVRSATDLLRLALAWGSGGYSMQRVAAWAGEQGIATLTEEALCKRLHGAGDFLQALTDQLLTVVKDKAAWHGRILRLADSTSLSKQASKGTDWRIHGVYDLGRGRFSHLELTGGHGAEALDRGKPAAGEIRIADRGYANARDWYRYVAAGEARTDFIVRMRWNTVRLTEEGDKPWDMIGWLKTLPAAQGTHEVTVVAQPGKKCRPIPIRLIAWRKTPEAIAAALKKLRRQASRKQTEIDPRSLVAAEYLIVATSLPEKDFPAEEVLAVYRLRWQIELAFKRLKSLMNIDEIRTSTEAGTRCRLYAHLIVAIICEEFCQDVLESFP